MTKTYYMVAIGKNGEGEPVATRIVEGYVTHGLGVDLSLLPPGTTRVAVMEKRAFDMILDAQVKKTAADVYEAVATSENPIKTST